MQETRNVNILIYLSVFISSITFFKEPFEGYFHYLIFLMLLPWFVSRFNFPSQIFTILMVPFITGIFEILMGNNTWALFLKIFIGMLLSFSFYYYVLQYYRFDTKKMFDYYLKGAIIVSYIGLVQFVSYIIHFKPGYDYHWLFNKWGTVSGGFGLRVNSVFSEPAQFAIVLSPACFVAIHNLFPGTKTFSLSRFQSALILLVFLLSASSTGYIGLFIILVLFILNYGQIIYLIFGIAILVGGGKILYNNVPEFQSRVNSSLGLWVSEELTLENINSSSFVLYNNYHIATENFKSNFLFGTGLGSHPIAYEKYSLTNAEGFIDFSFNKADANSMLLRILSETGLMGVVFIFIFIRRNFIWRNKYDDDDQDWIISNAILVMIMLYMMRQGNYFLNGFPFFMLLYYNLRKEREAKMLELANAQQEEEVEEGNEIKDEQQQQLLE